MEAHDQNKMYRYSKLFKRALGTSKYKTILNKGTSNKYFDPCYYFKLYTSLEIVMYQSYHLAIL